MKYLLSVLAALCLYACSSAPAVQTGDMSSYGIKKDCIFLQGCNGEYDVKLYVDDLGLCLETPEPIANDNCFGIQGDGGIHNNIKMTFRIVETLEDGILYRIPFDDMTRKSDALIMQNMQYCWVFYQFAEQLGQGLHKRTDFSPAEFDKYFGRIKPILY